MFYENVMIFIYVLICSRLVNVHLTWSTPTPYEPDMAQVSLMIESIGDPEQAEASPDTNSEFALLASATDEETGY